MNTNTRKLTYSALFLAFGILLPQIFHLFGGTGPVFLPMHIPVLLAGFFLGGGSGALIGLMTVLASTLLTGMPPVPILYFMLFEVAVYGLVAGLTYRKFKMNVYVSLILAMMAGRITLAAAVYTLQPLLGLRLSPAGYMTGALTGGIPGTVIQLIFIPALVIALERVVFRNGRTSEI